MISDAIKNAFRGLAHRHPIYRELVRLRHRVEHLEALAKVREAEWAEKYQWHIQRLLEQRAYLVDGNWPSGSGSVKVPSPIDVKPIEECYRLLEQAAPKAYAVWRRLVDVNSTCYEGFPVHSCSTVGHLMASHFAAFLRPYLRGTVLDVGCGPQPIPSYLLNHPVEQIAGVDPLLPPEGHPFLFVQGVAEFLPWPDESFDAVVVSTSLDHVFLLDKALAEIRRVLRPNGFFVTWVTFVAGAREYDPYHPDAGQLDEYHMFHFDRPWFERRIARYFLKKEEFTFCPPETSCFLSFTKNERRAAIAA
jgi:SAM-dependent methyltransferase